MTQPNHTSPEKISAPFRARIEKLGSDVVVRAIVALNVDDAGGKVASRNRGSAQQRTDLVQTVQAKAADRFAQLDHSLVEHGGRRLQEMPSAFGTVLVESTPAGILALEDCAIVKSILENQSVSLPEARGI